MSKDHVPTILIIEDESIVALDAKNILEQEGYKVAGVCRDAISGLRKAETSSPDVAIVDVNLVGSIDGISIARELSQRHGTQIIFATGFADDVLRQGTDFDYQLITKPFMEKDLLRAVRASLDQDAKAEDKAAD